ncbi:MAG: sulfite exporter TauE/SafE family protein, partial [Pseudomonadota bacterium]
MNVYLPIAEVSVNALMILAIGGGVGVLSGLFGVGGGFLMTPLLILIGIPPAVAVATGTNQIAAASFSGLLAHVRRKAVDFRMGTVMLVGGVAGSAAGVQLFAFLRTIGQVELVVSLLYVVFLGSVGGLMLYESVQQLRRKRRGTARRRQRHGWMHKLPFRMR